MYAPFPTSLILLMPTDLTVFGEHTPIKIEVAAKIMTVLSSFLMSKANLLILGVIGLLAMATGREGRFFLNIAYSWS